MENSFDHRAQNAQIQKSVQEGISDIFPISVNGRTLRISNISMNDNLSETDFPAQKETKLARGTWEVPIFASIEIVDDSNGRIISRRDDIKIGAIPKLTNRFSAIVGGNEYQVFNQIRRKSGVFSRQRKNGELESEFNLEKGANFSLELDPQKKIFNFILSAGTRQYRLYTLLNALGLPESEMAEAWGQSLFDINKKGALNNEISEILDIHKKILKPRGDVDFATAKKELQAYFLETKMNGEVNKITLGTAYSSVTPKSMLDASVKLLRINKGEVEQDERDSLIFKNIYAPDDLLKEYFKGHKQQLQSKLKNALRSRDTVRDVVPANLFTGPVRAFFTTSDLSSTPPQTNPVAMLVNARKTTSMGEGGIQNMHSITMETRDVQPSHIGFLDALSSPESLKIGVTVGLGSEVQKKGNQMAIPVINAKTGELEYKTPIDIYQSVVGFPDQFQIVNGKVRPLLTTVKVMNKNVPDEVTADKVDFYFRAPGTLFDFGANLIPFLPSTQGNRGSTAGRMITQALPLDNPETPLTVSMRDETSSYEDQMGSYLIPTLEQESGKPGMGGIVTKVDSDYVYVQGDDGKPYKMGLYKDFPLNQDGFLDSKPLVKEGDKIASNQILLKTNYSDDKGRLALGKNLTVAYVSYKGNSFEDAATITESAAKKLTHTSIDKINVFFNPKLSVFDLRRVRALYPEAVAPDNAQKLTEEGLPKKGEIFQKGEAIAAFLVKKEMDGLDASLKKLNKAIYSPYSKNITLWEDDDPGQVIDVRQSGRNIDIYIKSVHPFKEGDKLSGLYGDKHIVGKIIPDEEAPHRPDGTPVEIMVNPQGVQGRMNMGQLLSAATGKIALKRGVPYEVNNFGHPNADYAKDVMAELKKEGIDPNEMLRDGKNGDYLKRPVFVGVRPYLKLRHIVKKKQAAHDFGAYDIDDQPAGKGSQMIGVLDTYAYLGHGAKNLLREATSIKSRKNEEYMRNLQFGLPPSRPNPNFAFEKMLTYMKASGVDIRKNGHKLQLIPLTDKSVSEMSKGEITDPGAMLIGKNLSSRKGGLFDSEITGGQRGENFAHISLPTRLPNPMAELAIKSILDLTNNEYDAIMEGKKVISGKKGPAALSQALEELDVAKELETTKVELARAPISNVNKLNTKVRILDALHKEGLNAKEAYTTSKVLVIPPKFRPIYPLPSGDLQVSDINKHYRDVGLQAINLKEAMKEDLLTEDEQIKFENDLYNSVKAMQGFIDPMTYGKMKYKGALKDLGDTKSGLIFGTAWAKRQDLTGRSTITPEPSLGLDEVGLPDAIAKKIFKPLVVRKLKQSGVSASNALKYVNEEHPLAKNALLNVMEESPVLINRAPSLHKHSVQAFRPILMDGKDIRLNPMVVGGFNADFDGDQCINSVIFWAKTGVLENLAGLWNNSNFDIDINKKASYIYSKVNNNLVKKYMSARFNVTLPILKNGSFYISNLEDFPYDPTSLIGEANGVSFYNVPADIKVFSFDEKTSELVLVDAKGWSVHKDREIWTIDLLNKTQIISDDDPRAVYGIKAGTLDYVRNRPSSSLGMLVPVIKGSSKISEKSALKFIPGSYKDGSRIKEKVELNKKTGYVLGALCGDGWTDYVNGGYKAVNLAGIEKEVVAQYKAFLSEIFVNAPHVGYQKSEASYGESEKHIVSSVDFATWLAPLIGHKAKNKHLPPFWWQANRDFKIGLLSGLLDTDGSICISNGKDKPQLQSNISSTSLRMLQEIQQMLLSLDIKSRISFSKVTSSGNDFWSLGISPDDLLKLVNELNIAHVENIKALNTKEAYPDMMAPSAVKNDLVPVTRSITSFYSSKIGAKRDHPKDLKSLYAILNKAGGTGYLTRATAKKLISAYGEPVDEPLYKEWLQIINNSRITWVPVTSVENTGKKETGYDLTVPGYETFMSVDGTILSNTMSVMLPITYEGQQEAFGMFPSKILFKHGDNSLMPGLSQEFVFGISKLSDIEEDTGKTFKTISDAKEAKLDMNHQFNLDGKKMTIGQWELNEPLPESYRDYRRTFKGKDLRKLLEKIAKNEPGDVFARVINRYKDLGAYYAYKSGGTVSIDDMVIDRTFREDLIKKFDPQIKKIKDPQKRAEAYLALTADIEAAQNKQEWGKNRMLDLIDTGALSATKAGNVRQVLSGPGVVADTKGNLIPIPIFKSYSEGLDTFSYVNTLPGVRKGTVDRSVNTQESGALNKTLLSVNRRLLIVEEDCGTTEGLTMPINDKNVMDRTLLHGIEGVGKRGDIVNSLVVNNAKAKGLTELEVRSPLTCDSVQGVCQKCYGLMPNGTLPSIGTNVGVLESAAITERATQLTMQCTGNSFTISEDGKFTLLSECYTQKHPPHDIMVAIYLADGGCMIVQNNHPMWVNGNEEKLVRDINIKTDLIQNRSEDILKAYNQTEKNDTSALPAYVMGAFAGDGCFRYYDDTIKPRAIIITNMRNDIKEKLLNLSGVGKIRDEEFVIYSTDLGLALQKEIRSGAKNKALLINWAEKSREWVSSFISGLIDTDGCISRAAIKIYSTSFAMLDQVRTMSLVLGIPATLRLEKRRSHQKTQQYSLTLRGSKVIKAVLKESLKVQNWVISEKELTKVNFSAEFVKIKNITPLVIQSDIEEVYDRKTADKRFITGTYTNHNTFHTGGAASKNKSIAGSFPRLEQLIKVPETLSGKATLSKVDGQVTTLEKNEIGGWDVTVGSTKHIIEPGRNPVVSLGNNVKKGDRLSDGSIKPQELSEMKDHLTAQRYIVDELNEIYGGDFFKKSMETVIRGTSDNAVVTKAPDGSGFFRGDKTSTSYLKKINRGREQQGLEKLEFNPYFKSVDTLNVDAEDWMTRVTTNRVKDGLARGMAKMQWGDIAGKDPIPAYIYGDDFGQPEKKREDGGGFY